MGEESVGRPRPADVLIVHSWAGDGIRSVIWVRHSTLHGRVTGLEGVPRNRFSDFGGGKGPAGPAQKILRILSINS